MDARICILQNVVPKKCACSPGLSAVQDVLCLSYPTPFHRGSTALLEGWRLLVPLLRARCWGRHCFASHSGLPAALVAVIKVPGEAIPTAAPEEGQHCGWKAYPLLCWPRRGPGCCACSLCSAWGDLVWKGLPLSMQEGRAHVEVLPAQEHLRGADKSAPR